MAKSNTEGPEWPTHDILVAQLDRDEFKTTPEQKEKETDEYENALISVAMAKKIKEMVSQEIAKAQATTLLHLTERLSDTIVQSIKEELDKKLAGKVKEVTYRDLSACKPLTYMTDGSRILRDRLTPASVPRNPWIPSVKDSGRRYPEDSLSDQILGIVIPFGLTNARVAFMYLMNRHVNMKLICGKFLRGRVITYASRHLKKHKEEYLTLDIELLDLVKDYNCKILYHLGKVNVVADDLSKKTKHDALLVKSLQMVTLDFYEHIKIVYHEAWESGDVNSEHLVGQVHNLVVDSRGLKIRFGRIWIPNNKELKNLLLVEAYKLKYSIHPGATKMYYSLKPDYCWPGLKKYIVKYVEQCLTYLQVKTEHQQPYGKLQPPEIPRSTIQWYLMKSYREFQSEEGNSILEKIPRRLRNVNGEEEEEGFVGRDQYRIDIDKIWNEYGVDVIDLDDFHSGDKGEDE
uniref:Integrase zinc-binding domain-containing protein n=1 Tax=Tanacetum cinerariifolium TaxID=118510 RepID=A0A6L2KQ89_TANCI|nr:hypothetical protein [Tanacetum cinerariifolium]